MIYYSGCNININRGNHPNEPEGTALAMHDCTGCEEISTCKLKQTQEVFPYTPEIAAKMDADWKEAHMPADGLKNK